MQQTASPGNAYFDSLQAGLYIDGHLNTAARKPLSSLGLGDRLCPVDYSRHASLPPCQHVPSTARLRDCCVVGLGISLYGIAAAAEKQAIPSRERLEFFEKKIRPVLAEHCYKCHSAGAEKVGGGLLLDTRPGIRQGGESGPAVVPGDLDDSLLLEAIRHDGLEMPPDRKLPAEVIADFERWIRAGATDPRDGSVSSPAKSTIDLEAGRQFWSFRPPQPHKPPAVHQAAWPHQPIDHFILAKLETAGLAPAAEADRRMLIRRLSFDLTGLPPSVETVEDFVRDSSSTAYENAVERLLASPHYGERRARLWLDVSRFAEDQAHIVGDNDVLFVSERLFISRLGDSGVQRRPAIRPVRPVATGCRSDQRRRRPESRCTGIHWPGSEVLPPQRSFGDGR